MKHYYRKKSWVVLASFVDSLGAFVGGIGKVFPKQRQVGLPKKIKNILLLRLDHLGDVLYLTPAISFIRKQFPSAHITLVVGPWAKEIIEDNPDVNEIIYYTAPWFKRERGEGGNFVRLVQLIRQLREHPYDLAIDFKGYLWHIFLLFFSGAKYKVGYGDVGGGFLLDKTIPRRIDLHVVLQNIELLRCLGITSDESPKICLNISDEVKEKLDKLLMELNIRTDQLIAVHCGAGRPTKRWPIDRFTKLIARLGKIYPEYQVVLIGGKDEVELVRPLQIKSLVGVLNIHELAAFLSKCSLFIGNDSFPAHLAAVLGIPTIVLFSIEDDPIQWRPWGEKVVVLQAVPHEFRSLKEDEIKASLRKISIENVINAIKSIGIS